MMLACQNNGEKEGYSVLVVQLQDSSVSFGFSATVLGLAYVPHAFHKFSQQVCSFKFDHSS